jgi:L-lactate utilization protein LutB
MDAAMLREVGIVHLSEALQANATGVHNKIRVGGLTDTDIQSQFWCTLCSKCLARPSAYRHRDKHRKEWAKGNMGDITSQLHAVLDELYGVCYQYVHNMTRHAETVTIHAPIIWNAQLIDTVGPKQYRDCTIHA